MLIPWRVVFSNLHFSSCRAGSRQEVFVVDAKSRFLERSFPVGQNEQEIHGPKWEKMMEHNGDSYKSLTSRM